MSKIDIIILINNKSILSTSIAITLCNKQIRDSKISDVTAIIKSDRYTVI